MPPSLAGEWQHVPPPGLSETRHCNVYHRKVENLKAWPPWAPTIIRMRSGSVVNCQLNLTQMSPIWRISLASLDSRILCYSQRNRLRFFPGSSVYISDFSSDDTTILAISVPGEGAQAILFTQANIWALSNEPNYLCRRCTTSITARKAPTHLCANGNVVGSAANRTSATAPSPLCRHVPSYSL